MEITHITSESNFYRSHILSLQPSEILHTLGLQIICLMLCNTTRSESISNTYMYMYDSNYNTCRNESRIVHV